MEHLPVGLKCYMSQTAAHETRLNVTLEKGGLFNVPATNSVPARLNITAVHLFHFFNKYVEEIPHDARFIAINFIFVTEGFCEGRSLYSLITSEAVPELTKVGLPVGHVIMGIPVMPPPSKVTAVTDATAVTAFSKSDTALELFASCHELVGLLPLISKRLDEDCLKAHVLCSNNKEQWVTTSLRSIQIINQLRSIQNTVGGLMLLCE